MYLKVKSIRESLETFFVPEPDKGTGYRILVIRIMYIPSRLSKNGSFGNSGQIAQSVVESVHPYFDTSAYLAGVQYKYNYKHSVYSTSTL